MYAQYLRSEILFTDSIYDKGKIPENAKGKYLKYTVKSYDEESETFTVKYEMQAINPYASTFVAFAEGDGDSTIPGLDLKAIKNGRSLYTLMLRFDPFT